MEKEQREQLALAETADIVELQFTDLFGQCKMVEMTGRQAAELSEKGYAMNRFALGGLKKEESFGSPIPKFLEDCKKERVVYLKPDWSTWRMLPWESAQETVGRVFCEIGYADGESSWADSRSVLKRMVQTAEAMGIQVAFTFQCECYLFHTDEEGRPTTITHEVAGYYDAGSIDLAGSVRRDMMLSLADAGIQIESVHHGLTPGQHCFKLAAQSGAEAGDYLQTFKAAVKRIAKSHGLHATFMPKPNQTGDGSGLHIGVQIRDSEGKSSRQTAEYFRAGVLTHLRDMLIFTNPLVNSYKRLANARKHVFQPEFPATDWENGNDKAVYVVEEKDGCYAVQVLFPDPSANPYLALSAILSAGLDGVRNRLSYCEEEKLQFPETLGVLLEEFEKNQFARDTFGELLCRMYAEGKTEEWDRFCASVTDWETREYLYRC